MKVVQATPQAVALEMPYTSWSYQQLSEKALKIGSYLQALGGQPGELVSLALPKSPEYIVALLGVWSAGMAFVPIDPSLPSARQDWLKEHAQANYQLDAKILTRLKNQTISPNLPIRPQPEDWAYLIYTSGSTGHPKGVCIPHRGLVSVLTEQIVIFGLKPGKKALWFLSPQFDASLSDIGTALLSGATLCLADEPLIPSPQAFYALLTQRKITHLDLPPALLHVLDPDAFPAYFETLMIGGEAAPIEEVRRWSAKFRVINIYGPTEATICTSLGECGPDWNAPLLGKPLAGVSYQLVDTGGKNADQGELWIAAPGLAWGYHREPKLSSERFVWWAGKRWYRTGDKVRRIGDSYLFLGRLDRQLKLQGRLLAPEEIEQSLQKHPALAEVAIIEKAGGLVAFFTVMAGTVLPTHSELNAFLREKLPPWMIPVRYYCQSDLPRTPTGKIDYPALARLDLAKQEYSIPAQATTPLAQQLRQIWQRVLETETLGLNSDFFALGGNSIKVLQAVGLAYGQGLWLHPELFYTQPIFQGQLAALESLVKGQSMMLASPLRQSVLAYSPPFFASDSRPPKRPGFKYSTFAPDRGHWFSGSATFT